MADKSFEEIVKEFPCTEQIKNIQRCARAAVIASGLKVRQYTYAANNRLYTAEEANGQWSLREETSLHSAVRDMAVMLGDSPIYNSDLFLTLTPNEAACFLAIVDCYSLAVLQAAAQAPITSSATPKQIAHMLNQPRRGGLLEYLYTICEKPEAETKATLQSLVNKEVCRFANGEYILDAQSADLAKALARPFAAVSLCVWSNVDGAEIHIPSLAVQGSLHDILYMSSSSEEITISSLSADSLLNLIEKILSCPNIDIAPTNSNPNAEPEAEFEPEPKLEPEANAAAAPIIKTEQSQKLKPVQNRAPSHASKPVPHPEQEQTTSRAPSHTSKPAFQPVQEQTPKYINSAFNSEQKPVIKQPTKHEVICPFCKNRVRAGAKFCNSCGKSLAAALSGKSNGLWVCSCGNTNKGKFCSRCGSKAP